MRFRSLMITTALGALMPVAAFAQTETSAQDDSEGLDEIVVTAQFRQENLQKVAIAVNVISGEDIGNAGVTGPSELTNLVPSLQISQGGAGSQSFFIRGVGTLTANSYTDPGVAFNVDGIYIGRPTSVRNTFFDIERVEVLKGPQGTLYGRNATGGAINVLPSKPKLGETSGEASAAYGNYNDLSLGGHVNLPLGEKVAARFAGTYNKRDGYNTDGTSDADGYAFRGQLLFKPSDTVTIRVGADYAHDGGKGAGAVITGYINPLSGQRVNNPLPLNVGPIDARTTALYNTLYSFQAGRFGRGFAGNSPFIDNTYWGLKGQIDADLDFATLTALASYRKTNLDSLEFGSGFPARSKEKDSQYSVEVRLAGPDTGVFRWLTGVYFYKENIKSTYQFNTDTLTAFQDLTASTSVKAAFARFTIAPMENLRLIGGVRYTDEYKLFDGTGGTFLNTCALAPFPPAANCGGSPAFPTTLSAAGVIQQMGLIPVAPNVYIQPSNPGAANSRFIFIPIDNRGNTLATAKTNFRAAIEYDVGPSNLLYASFENGFHAGGFAFAKRLPTYKPEFIDAYTIGSKNRFADGKVQLNIEAFIWKYRDQQITHFGTDTTGTLAFYTENAGRSTNKGFEIEAIAKPMRNTTLSANVQFLDAKYAEFKYDAPNLPTAPPLFTGCPTTPAVINGTPSLTANCAGFTALRSPKWTINAGIVQVVPVGGLELTLGANTRYQSKSVIGFEMLKDLSEQPGYFTTNISADFGPADGKWSIGAFANNLENNLAIGQSFFNNQIDVFASVPSAPRTFGMRARYKF